MSTAAVRRTLRRGIALLALPLSGVAIGLDEFVWSDAYGASPPTLAGDVVYGFAPRLLFLGALVYLLGAGVRDLFALVDRAAARESEAAGEE